MIQKKMIDNFHYLEREREKRELYSIYYYYCNDTHTLLISNKTELLINRGGVRWSWT